MERCQSYYEASNPRGLGSSEHDIAVKPLRVVKRGNASPPTLSEPDSQATREKLAAVAQPAARNVSTVNFHAVRSTSPDWQKQQHRMHPIQEDHDDYAFSNPPSPTVSSLFSNGNRTVSSADTTMLPAPSLASQGKLPPIDTQSRLAERRGVKPKAINPTRDMIGGTVSPESFGHVSQPKTAPVAQIETAQGRVLPTSPPRTAGQPYFPPPRQPSVRSVSSVHATWGSVKPVQSPSVGTLTSSAGGTILTTRGQVGSPVSQRFSVPPPPKQGHPRFSFVPSRANSALAAPAGLYDAPEQCSSPSAHGSANSVSRGVYPTWDDRGSTIGDEPDIRKHPAYINTNIQAETSQYASTAGRDSQASCVSPISPLTMPSRYASAAASPPPLPEGWIANLDPGTRHYYYIHLPTQSTQWQFPHGPTPLSLRDGQASPYGSPPLSAFSGTMTRSPTLSATTTWPGYETTLIGSDHYPGPLITSGIEQRPLVPANEVYFGPYLRYNNINFDRGLWLGSILLVTESTQPPSIHIHQSADLSPNPRQLHPIKLTKHRNWVFYKYVVELPMEEQGAVKWTYAVTSPLGCTRYEFLVAGLQDLHWRMLVTSGNDFSSNVNAAERSRLGGADHLWKDILQKHHDCGGFHVHLSPGGQICGDRIWKDIPALRQWLAISGKENRKTAPWTVQHEEEVSHAYFHYYTSHLDLPHLREAFAQIPIISQIDGNDIFAGYGSYPEYTQQSNVFRNIRRVATEMYLLFQHHTSFDGLSTDPGSAASAIEAKGWNFVKYIGPALAVVGIDCRSERTTRQMASTETYSRLIQTISALPSTVQHCIFMTPVPLVFPRQETTANLMGAVQRGKKGITGTYNVLGKVTSSVAGIVGVKEVVESGFDNVKKAVGKTGLMEGLIDPFGRLNLLGQLHDQWTHGSKQTERTYLIRSLQQIASQKSLRFTFLSGGIGCCAAGLLHDPDHPRDNKTMYQLISAPVVDAPLQPYLARLFNHRRDSRLYVPREGKPAKDPTASTDTKEDMIELFYTGTWPGQAENENRVLMPRRNYLALVAYDPTAATAPVTQSGASVNGSIADPLAKVNLAADFFVQGEGSQATMKYGPVVVPNLEMWA